MDKSKITSAIKKAKEGEERKFTQTIDLIITLKNFDVKKDEKIDEFVTIDHMDKPKKVCALVGPEMKDEAKKACDEVIISTDFSKWAKPRQVRKLADNYDYFIAQADIMPQIAKVFGKYFGPRGKMPNPKGGQIFPPKATLTPVVNRLRNTIKVGIKKDPTISCSIGTEKLDNEKLVANALQIIEHLEHKLPQGMNNINKIIFKTSMGKPVKV